MVIRGRKRLKEMFTSVSKAKEWVVSKLRKEIEKKFNASVYMLKRNQDLKLKMREYKKLCKERSMLLSNLLLED